MKTQSTAELFNLNNKAIESKIIKKCKDLPIITKHFTTANDEAYNEPIVTISQEQKTQIKKLIQ